MSSDPLHPSIVRQLEREQRADQAKTTARTNRPPWDHQRTPLQMGNDILDAVPDDREREPSAVEWGNLEVACERLAVVAAARRRAAALDEADQ